MASVAIQSSEVMSLSMTTGTGPCADTLVAPLNAPSTHTSTRQHANLLNIALSPSLNPFLSQVARRVWRTYSHCANDRKSCTGARVGEWDSLTGLTRRTLLPPRK